MKFVKALNWISLIFVFFGALNWAVVGMANFNMIGAMTMGYRSGGAITLYVLIGLSALWLIASMFISRGRIALWDRHEDRHHSVRDIH